MKDYQYVHYYCPRSEVRALLDEAANDGWRLHTFTQSGSMCDLVFEKVLD